MNDLAKSQVQVPATRKVSALEALKMDVTKMESQIKMILPAHVSYEKFQRIVFNALQTNPSLIGADRPQFFAAVMKSAQDGLLPDGREAALVCYGAKVTYIPMIAGVMKMIRNSGEVKDVSVHCVHEHDEFDYWNNMEGENFVHKPNVRGDRGGFSLAYALVRTRSEGHYFLALSKKEIDKVRSCSKANKGPWFDWYEEMAMKTVIKKLSKRLPMSTDLIDRFQKIDNDFEEVLADDKSVVQKPKNRTRSRLQDVMKTEEDEYEDVTPENHPSNSEGVEEVEQL